MINRESLIGKRFGKLVVIESYYDLITPGGQHKPRWFCQCDCGNIAIVLSSHLKSGHTTSCGCAHKDNIKNITGTRSGKLTAIKYVGTVKHRAMWLCKCDCGNEAVINGVSFTRGAVQSCGCMSSKAEYALAVYLNKLGILYMQQYTFDECKDKHVLPFDFAIFDKDSHKLMFLVELQGEQHYYPFTFNNEPQKQKEINFAERKRVDKIKSDFCNQNKIPILYIKYTHFDRLEEIFDKFYQEMQTSHCLDRYEFHEKEMKIHKHQRYRAKVCQIDIPTKTIVARYDTFISAANAVGVSDGAICDVCNRKAYTAKGYAWAYDEDNLDIEDVVNFAKSKEEHIGGKRKVLQYDKDETFIKEWNSMTDAANSCNIPHSSIYNCCKGKQKTAAGYIWKYKN